MLKRFFLSLQLQTTWTLTAITFFAGLLHFYNLSWGAPFFFHPDERNIASSVSQISFPNEMNPHFFAYGSLPIYAIYFLGLLLNNFQNPHIEFSQAIIIGRLYSALFATLLVPLMYITGKVLSNKNTGIFAAILTATSTGLMQFAHFGTFELWLTFFTVILFLICLKMLHKKSILYVFLSGLIFGILVATKISHLVVLPLVCISLLLSEFYQVKQKKIFFKITSLLFSILLFVTTATLIYAATNPFVFFDNFSFQNSMHYESGVALGTLPVFYTGEFYGTTPVIFQLQKIYPFLLNPVLEVIFIIFLCFISVVVIIKKQIAYLMLLLFFACLFLSQAFIFAKWTRYMVPTLPFIYLIIAVGLNEIKQKRYLLAIKISVLLISSIFALSYFITAFIEKDSRITAVNFANQTIPADEKIVSEVYDLGIMPFNNTFRNVELFNFYDLDTPNSGLSYDSLQQKLVNANFIILPSQRVLEPRIANSEKFPKGHAFYKALESGTLGYKKIYETPCSLFCKITYLNNPVFGPEQTVSVFDRPTLFIYARER